MSEQVQLSVDDTFGGSDAVIQVLLCSEAGPLASGIVPSDIIRQAKEANKKATSIRLDMKDGHDRPIGSMRLKFKESDGAAQQP